jgi:hypothetical protein
MAFKIETCYTDQTATVKKLLDKGFEPFSAFPIKAKKNDVFVTRVKMYFRRNESQLEPLQLETMEPFKLDTAPFAGIMTDALSAFFDQIKRSDERLVDTLGELITEVRKLNEEDDREIIYEHKVEPMTGVDVDSANRVKELDDDNVDVDFVERKEVSGATRVDIDDERHDVREGSLISGAGPEGDSFRVIDDVPPEAVVSRARTEAQDQALNKIRQINDGTNLSIFTPNDQGYVRVLAANWVYLIAPDGTYSEEETKANLSSLMVE